MADHGTRESQRRHATVFFADISGFTAMSEKLDPEEVTEVMNDCFAMVERIVHDHGGEVDKFIGDAVMALFGASRAIENAPRRAVLASLDIRRGLERFNRERRLPVPLHVHIGVNSGLVIAGHVGGEVKRDFTVMGDTVNLAARLEDASEKGQIFVGPATYAATQGDFEYRPTKPLDLKGKSAPVQAYEVLAVKQHADLRRLGATTRHISSAFVGREREAALLRGRFKQFAGGEGGIVSIIGEAGLGKSRLLAEMSRSPDLERATVLVGRCDSLGTGRSYHPFAELLCDWSGVDPAADEVTALAKLEAACRDLLGDEGADALPFIATVMGLRVGGPYQRRIRAIRSDALEKLVLKSTYDVFAALARRRPLALCFEDLHWADLSSVKLLESLLHIADEHPVLFLLVARPGFEETSDRLRFAARDRFPARALEIVLEPLRATEAHALVRNLLRAGNLPQQTRDVIAVKAEGNPFFIEEVVRALIDQGAVAVHEGRLRVTEDIESVTIPGTLQEVILTRVERLDATSQRLLQVAAVLGRSFSYRLFVETAAVDELEAAATFAVLIERQVLFARDPLSRRAPRSHADDGDIRDDAEYSFQHALIQAAIYESTLHRTRRALHLRAAEAIERLYADEIEPHFAALALHYGRAAEPRKAEEYLLKAGDAAARSAASSEALAHFREAYRLFRDHHGANDDPGVQLQLEKRMASALMVSGHLAEARPHCDRALALLGERVVRTKKAASRQLAFDTVRILLRMYVMRGRMSRRPCTPELREAIAILYMRCRAECVADPEWFAFDAMYMVGRLATVDPHTIDEAFAQWAGVALLFSYSGASLALSRRVLKVARSLVREDNEADFFIFNLMHFMCDYFEGIWDRPDSVDDALTERVLRAGLFWDVDTFLGMDAYKAIDQGDWQRARRRWSKICEIADAYGYGFAETNKRAIPIFEAVARRELHGALADVDAYLERPEEMLNLIGLGNKAKILTLLARHDEARAVLAQADELERRIGRATPFHSGWLRVAKLQDGVVALAEATRRGDRRTARSIRRRVLRDASRALRTAAVLAMIRTEVYRHIGTLHWLSGSRRRAASWWSRSVAEARRLGARPELGRTHVEIASHTATHPLMRVADLDATGHVAAARELFTVLGLRRDLEMLDAQRVHP